MMQEKDGGQSKEGWRERKGWREGGSALRLKPFNETVIYSSPRNHKT